ncbi:MAG: hypothetical protein L3J76_04970, partial [Candidatus Hydrothermae bacterium]|nr:hypothetical protein [Candidatus Hydrothermae bacterium]
GIPDQFSPIQLMVYDFSNPAQPVQLSSMVTSAYDAILAGSRLYGWWADTVDVLDVSNPAQPTHLGASALSGQVEAVFPFRGDTLLVVIYGNGSPHVLKFLDATQPGAMQEGAAVTQSDNGFIRDVQVIGDTLLVVRDSLLEIWDVSNPAASTLLGSYDFGQGDPRRLNTIAFQGHRLVAVAMHVGSPYSDTGAVKLLDITQPGQPQVVAFYEARDFYPQWVHFQVDGQGNLRTLVLNSWDYRVFSVAPTAVAERSVRGELGLLPRVMRGAMRFPAGVRGKITVLDALGREVLSRSVRGGRPVPLRPGVYFWRLERDRQVYQGRVLILP